MAENNMTYMVNTAAATKGLEVWKTFQAETKSPMETTISLLMKLLRDNKDTECGRRYGFADIHSVEEYQQKVPVVVYDNIAPELERMMMGEKNILTAYPFNHFNETSGTVGVPKVVPMTEQQEAVFARYSNQLMYGIMMEQMTPEWREGRAFCTSGGTCRTLKSGLTVGEAAAKIADHMKGGKDALDAQIRTIYTSPIEAMTPAPGTDELLKIFVELHSSEVFSTPKPTKFIERILQLFSGEDLIVLDSFAGSGTTAHAVLNMNKADGGHRKFILVEMGDYAESITAERVRRVIDGYGEGKSAVPGTGGSFSYYELGTPLFVDGFLNPDVPADEIRAYVYYSETHEISITLRSLSRLTPIPSATTANTITGVVLPSNNCRARR